LDEFCDEFCDDDDKERWLPIVKALFLFRRLSLERANDDDVNDDDARSAPPPAVGDRFPIVFIIVFIIIIVIYFSILFCF